MPMSNLAAAASNLAPNESVRYVRKHYRYRDSSRGYSGYAADCRYGYGPSSRCYP
jgi:Asp-tRNA(Asn)/Glu-tRNA(Gln) amidotransferase B subunit